MVVAIGCVKGVLAFPSLWLLSYIKERLDVLWDWVSLFMAGFVVFLCWMLLDAVGNILVDPQLVKANRGYFFTGFFVGGLIGRWLILRKSD
jgi:hypothetical protein